MTSKASKASATKARAQSSCRIKAENAELELLCGRVTDSLAAGYEALPPHTHRYTEIFACISGEITLAAEESVVTLSEGEAAIVPQKSKHVLKNIGSGGSFCSLGVRLTELDATSGVDLCKIIGRLLLPSDGESGIRRLDCPELCASIAELSEAAGSAAPICALKILYLLARLSEELSEGADASGEADYEIDRISALENIIYNEYAENITLDRVASEMFISRRQLCRIVKKQYGTTFHRAVLERRVLVAAKKLAESDEPVSAIAETVGFADAEALGRHFARLYGVSPAEYRKKARKA